MCEWTLWITPIIKKQSLGANIMKNCRLVANIPFTSKLIEKLVPVTETPTETEQ